MLMAISNFNMERTELRYPCSRIMHIALLLAKLAKPTLKINKMQHSFAYMLQIESDKCQYKDVDAEESKHHTYAQFSTYNLLKREGGRGHFIDQCLSRCDSFAGT